MFSFKNVLLASLILAASVAPLMAAGGDRGDWELGLYGGYVFPDDYERPVGIPLALEDELLFGLRAGYWFTPVWSAELSWQTAESSTGFPTPTPNVDVDLEALRFNLVANFGPGTRVRPFVTVGFGNESVQTPGLIDIDDVAPNLGAGLRVRATETFGLRWDIRHIWADHGSLLSGTQNNVEATFGLGWTFGGAAPSDLDGDGVSDRKDRCPDTPRGATVDATGCPSDGDGDGVFDGIDRCPDTPPGHKVDDRGCSKDSDGDGVFDGPDACPGTPRGAKVDAKGCPKDSDGDGVLDGIDRCPDTPKGAQVDTQGCPKDSDGDGVFDGIDRCPDTPKGAQVDARGCPKDGDGDGVFDGIDRCPDTAPGTKVDAKGCAVLFKEEQKVLVLDNVLFEFNSAALTTESKRTLDRIAAALIHSFADVRLEVAGHTDSVGSERYNRDLSQRRAESVVKHLGAAGVDVGRLQAKGYGEAQPIADNASSAGRAKNRRVELRRLN